jgi:hypothetical protein
MGGMPPPRGSPPVEAYKETCSHHERGDKNPEGRMSPRRIVEVVGHLRTPGKDSYCVSVLNGMPLTTTDCLREPPDKQRRKRHDRYAQQESLQQSLRLVGHRSFHGLPSFYRLRLRALGLGGPGNLKSEQPASNLNGQDDRGHHNQADNRAAPDVRMHHGTSLRDTQLTLWGRITRESRGLGLRRLVGRCHRRANMRQLGSPGGSPTTVCPSLVFVLQRRASGQVEK